MLRYSLVEIRDKSYYEVNFTLALLDCIVL